MTAGYELVREFTRRYENRTQRDIDSLPSKFAFFSISPHLSLEVRLAPLVFLQDAPTCQITTYRKRLVSLPSFIEIFSLQECKMENMRKVQGWLRLVCEKRKAQDDSAERSSLLWSGRDSAQAQQKTKVVKAALYALQVFYSFFIMLLFMTYNGWIMLAVAVGAFVGYLAFGGSSAAKVAACH